MWSISIVKDRRYLQYFILCLEHFSSERPPLSKIFYSMCGPILYQKTAILQRSVAKTLVELAK